MPLIVTSSKPNLCFLIDTGATHNIVFSYVYEELPQLFSPIDNTSLMIGIEGEEKNVELVETTLSFENKETTAIFSVMDATRAVKHVQQDSGIEIHGILASHFYSE